MARAAAGVWLLLHLFMVAAIPVADGAVSHTDRVVVHIEDADGGNCPASHGPEHCTLCQYAHGLRALPGTAESAPAALPAAEQAPIAARQTRPVAASFLAGHSSRAPPVLG